MKITPHGNAEFVFSNTCQSMESMGLWRFVSVPVVVVLLIIGFVYHTVVVLVIHPWLNVSTATGFANVALLTILCTMALLSYTLAVVRDPGYIPSSYLPDLEDEGVALQEVKRKGGDRYCQKCEQYKPPRAHHCRVCKRCVLRMDHHCVWINNCVGHNNYKPFFLFVLYVVGASLQSMILLATHFIHTLGEELPAGADAKTLSTSAASSALTRVICAVVLVPVLIAVGVLMTWHFLLLLHNKTTIEYHEGVRAKWLAEKAGHRYRHPYDVGVFTNLVTALGPSVTCWFCPTATGHLGPGLRFQTCSDDILEME